jgi:hypothetical protein
MGGLMDMSSSLKGPLLPSEAEVRIAAELAGGSVLGIAATVSAIISGKGL